MHFLSWIFSFERQKFWFVHEKNNKQIELVFAHAGVLKAGFISSANRWANSKLAIVSRVNNALSNTYDNTAITASNHHHQQHYVSYEMYHLCQYEYDISSPNYKHNNINTARLL